MSTKNHNDLDLIIQNLYLGNMAASDNKAALQRLGITHILSVTSSCKPQYSKEFEYKQIEVLDMPSTNLTKYFDDAAEFISEGITGKNKCLVHCNAGISRSTSMVMAYLIIYR